jgi:hypothetical protein
VTLSPRAQRPLSPPRWLLLALALAALLVLVEVWAQFRHLPDLAAASALTAYLLAALAGAGAAGAFGPGDHLRRAWALVGAGYLGLGLGRLLFPADLLGLPDGAALSWTRSLVTLASNACWVGGTAHFAVTWLRTGLPLPGTRRGRWLVAAVLTAAILGLVGPDLVSSIAAALRGDVYAGSVAIGDATDVLSFLLMVPVVLTARALAGGSLAWPFALLCASDLAWLLLDGFSTYGGVLGVTPPLVQATVGALRTLGCLLFAVAGITQRRAIRCAARSSARP